MTIRLRVLPRFPANISGSVGLTVEREGVDLVIKPDYGALTQVPSVIEPDTTFLQVWQEDDDMYVRMSFNDIVDAVTDLGFMNADVYDPTGIAADVFARANHTGEQAISTVTGLQAALDLKAPLASPAFTGNPTAPTPAAADNDTSIATTAFVQGELTTALALKAPLASPAFTGNPTAPTPSPGDNDTSIATTAFVTAAVRPWTEVAPVATTSGSAIDWTSIPSGVSEIELWFDGVSVTSTDSIVVQLGTGGSPTTSGYASGSGVAGTSGTFRVAPANGFGIFMNAATNTLIGRMSLHKTTGNTWVSSHAMVLETSAGTSICGGGSVTLAGVLDNIRLTRQTGSQTFDAGSVRVRYR